MDHLLFTTLSNAGTAYDIEFPLHPETSSADTIAELSTELLNEISKSVGTNKNLKEGDILQALSMVCAIRCRMLNVESSISKGIFLDLFETNHSAVLQAKTSIATRA